MEREVAWTKYDEASLDDLEALAVDYIDFISENKTERECAAAVRAVVDERGVDAGRVEAAARKAFDAWGALDIVVKQGSARPPKSPEA